MLDITFIRCQKATDVHSIVDQRNWKDIENVMIFINVVNTISYVIIKVKDLRRLSKNRRLLSCLEA